MKLCIKNYWTLEIDPEYVPGYTPAGIARVLFFLIFLSYSLKSRLSYFGDIVGWEEGRGVNRDV